MVRCGGCGQRGARCETRSVFHRKRPGAPQAHFPQQLLTILNAMVSSGKPWDDSIHHA
jgi:hypothetical protein